MRRIAIALVIVSSLAFGGLAVGESLLHEPHAVAQAPRRPVRRAQAKNKNKNTPTPPPAQNAPGCNAETGEGCPLHDWMEANVTPVMEAEDTARLATLYDQIGGFAPDPSFNVGANGWRALSEAGATKARAGDFRGARASCKQCHTSWRDRYRAEFRARVLPR